MTAAQDSGPTAGDRRLWRRLRTAMLTTLLLSLAILAIGYGGAHYVAFRYDAHLGRIAALERLELLSEKLAVETMAAQQAGTPVHRMTARGTISRVESALGSAIEVATRPMPAVTGSGSAAAAVASERLAARLGEILSLSKRVRASLGTAESRSLARRLARITGRDLRPKIQVLIEDHRERIHTVMARVEGAGIVLAGLSVVVALRQWVCAFRPLLRESQGRTRALMAANVQIRHSMQYDPLTGLANRSFLVQQLERRSRRGGLGVIHVDLLGFHEINTTLGWETGDLILRYVSNVLRETALASEFVARINSDDFVLATTTRSDPEQLQEVAVEILRRLGQSIDLDGHRLTLRAVIGVAARGTPDEPVEKILANADIARSRARDDEGLAYFSTEMRERLAIRRQTAQDLLQALVADQIEPFFQPQIDARTGRLVGFEALARWRHAERGVLGPYFFLDVAEHANLGQRITRAISAKACAALAGWRRDGLEIPRIALNVTARELRRPDIAEQLLFDLDRAGLAPKDMGIEVLESALIDRDDDPILANVARLSELGFAIDLDDFGTGHASLSNLQRLHVDRLKIDRSFVRDLHLKPELQKMTLAMIQLAETIGIGCLAEGVETRNEWRLLVELGCRDLQGFAIGRPMPVRDVPAWIARQSRTQRYAKGIAAA
ncbi:MAG: putative bifunctional diguanylate cyclase/phosphodiesterase [Paracoccaceae bacterium]